MTDSAYQSPKSPDPPRQDGHAPDAAGVIVIRDVNQLAALRTSIVRSAHLLRIEVPGIDAELAQPAAERMKAFATECGCSMGAKSMAALFSISFVWLAVSHGVFNSQFVWRLPWTLLWAVAGAVAGKVLGIVHARRQLRSEIKGFIASATAQER